ncbi:MAG TPA: hypothetical protein VHC97_19340 [Thermoanaerobaculia bacterium]|nr:hypothetical protein [Thermoanaerobaculia bacterium]
MNEHLTAAELDLAWDKKLSPQRLGEIGRHLIEGCRPCRAMLARAYRPSEEPLAPEEDAEYNRVITTFVEWGVRAAEKFKQGDTTVRLSAMMAAAEASHVFDHRGKQLATYEELLRRSWAARHDAPREMVELASAALHVAGGLDPSVHGAGKIADYQAQAWGELGNAFRAADDHWKAHQAFGKAFQLAREGTGDRLLKAHLHDIYSSLLGDQRKFDLAFQNIDIVVDLYKEVHDQHLAGRALIKKAIYTHYNGQSEKALEINQQGLALIDENRDPGLPVTALQNRATFLVACRRFKDAKILLFKNRRRINDAGRIIAVKLRWLDGLISYGMADYETAESIFQEVRENFEAAALGFAAALASLDLAMAQMRQGKNGAAKEIAMEAAGVFAALNIHREVLGAVEVLSEAFRRDLATADLVERVVSFIREWEINPEALFFPPSE